MNEITIEELQETIDAASMGIWRIELFEDETPRMKATPMRRKLLGLHADRKYSDEEIYLAMISNGDLSYVVGKSPICHNCQT